MQSAELQTLEFHPVEFYDMAMQDRVFDQHVLERSKRNLLALHSRAHGHVGATSEAALASMCPTTDNANPNSKASASCQLPSNGSGSGTSTRTSSGCYQKGDTKAASKEDLGPGAHHDPRQQGSEIGANSMAVLRDPLSHEAALQRSRSVDPLCGLQSEIAVHADERESKLHHKDREPGNGVSHASTAASTDGRVQAECCDLPGHAEEDRRRGDAHGGNSEGSGNSAVHFACIPKGKVKSDKGISVFGVSELTLEWWWRKASTRTSCTST